MIHQVKVSKKNFELLNQVLELQRVLLQIAADELVLTPSSDSLTGNVEIALQGLYGSTLQAKEVAKWITRKKQKRNEFNDLFKSLQAFSAHTNSNEKQDFVKGVRDDVELLHSPRQARLEISLGTQLVAWQQAARDFFLEFYEILGTGSGLPAFLFGSSVNAEAFTRWNLIDNFTEANPELRICAVCDSTLYRTTIGDRPYASIEHFFPKSRYPHLAVHPRNLVPICPSCNSGAAGSSDPFGDDDLGVLGLLLPYQGDIGLGTQSYMYVNCVKASNDDNGYRRHPFELKMLPANNYPDAKTLIANFERIYKVTGRWNKEMDWIDEHVFRRITQFLMSDVQTGNQLKDIGFLKDRLRVLMAIVSMDNFGKDPFGFATVWLLKYHIDSLEKFNGNPEDIPIVAALSNWASGQQERWAKYRKHADDVVSRVADIE